MAAPGMPAEQAWLRAANRAVAVNGHELKGLPATRVVNLIAGDPNTRLVLVWMP